MVFLEHSSNFRIYRNRLFAQENRRCVRWLVLDLSIPRMRTNVGNCHTFLRIWVQYFGYQILGGLTQERWNFILRLDDFLI